MEYLCLTYAIDSETCEVYSEAGNAQDEDQQTDKKFKPTRSKQDDGTSVQSSGKPKFISDNKSSKFYRPMTSNRTDSIDNI